MRIRPDHPATPRQAARRAAGWLHSAPWGQCEFNWHPLPEPVGGDPRYIAVDGGNALIETETATFYLVKAWAGRFNPLDREARLASVNVVRLQKWISERVSTYREILEAAVAYKVMGDDGANLLLMDGSPEPVMRWWAASTTRLYHGHGLNKAREVLRSVASLIESTLGVECSEECIEDLIRDGGLRPSSAYAVSLVPDRLLDSGGGMWVRDLETLERLYAYKTLFEEAWRRGSRIVYITKTVRRSELCDRMLSDTHYIRLREPSRPGYTYWGGSLRIGAPEIVGILEPMEPVKDERLEEMYPRYLDVRSFYTKRVAVLGFYARLSPWSPVLYIAEVLPAREALEIRMAGRGMLEERINGLLSLLLSLPGSRVPGSGYPAGLVRAHMEAHVTEDDKRGVEAVLRLDAQRPNRSMLVE